jgi:hypothetical protein
VVDGFRDAEQASARPYHRHRYMETRPEFARPNGVKNPTHARKKTGGLVT